ncbi:MAG: insulinase family protein [Gemmatimonadetes bacterium]|nr:insulinase family protein [Gemmatimonadota bacterium]
MRLPARTLVAAACLGALAPGAAAQTPRGDELPVHEIRLENGMRFLVLARPGAPTVSFVAQYDVGGVNEHLGTTGIAHLLEHLLFKGTTSVGTRDAAAESGWLTRIDAVHDSLMAARGSAPVDTVGVAALEARIGSLEDSARTLVVPNELDEILSRNGAQSLNAMTTNESTLYYVELPANRAELWFVLEADRMAHPVFREFYTERDVVMEERRMRVDTSPGGLLYEAHLAAAFEAHPYGVPVIGWMSDIRTHGRDKVEDYYRRYYGPNNAVVAVVGDIDPDQVEAWARRYFAPIPAGERPPAVLIEEPEQKGERRVEVRFDAEPAVRIGWHTVDVSHPDEPALLMLSALLTGGRTSRLYHKLVLEDRLATYVGSSLGPGERYPALFSIEAYPVAPHTTAELEASIYAEIAKLAETGPDEIELERVRNQLEAGTVRRLQSNFGLAMQLAGSASAFGDWRTTFRFEERLTAVGREDIRRVAARYLRPENRTVATLVKSPTAAGEAGR